MDIKQEIMKHIEWIESVISMLGNDVVSKDEIQNISRHDNCELGRWLDSEESAQYNNFSEFDRLKESHKAFHIMAAELILAMEQGNETQAVTAQEQFVALSQKIIGYLTALQEHVDDNCKHFAR